MRREPQVTKESWRAIAATLVALALCVAAGPGAEAAPPPDPLPWKRFYVDPAPLSPDDVAAEFLRSCLKEDLEGPAVYDNMRSGVPTLGVIGDSVQGQARMPSLADTAYRWVYGTHCGDNYGTAISSGRLASVLATNPNVVVAGPGSNNYTYFWHPTPDAFPAFEANFEQFLDLTDGVPCRVIFNIVDRWHTGLTMEEAAQWHDMNLRANAMFASINPTAHPNVIVIDWNLIVSLYPSLILDNDDQHLTHAGINARINAAVAASRRCFTPDTPQGIGAVAGNASATVWWQPLPAEEGVTSYRVTASTGQQVTTSETTVNVAGLTSTTAVSFTVSAINKAGESSPSVQSNAVIPTTGGTRFHAIPPTRVLDTRNGTGGKATPFGPGESFQIAPSVSLPAEAATASALVLNVTATGQTSDTFVTVWPGAQPRPLASNLNPEPGVAAVPAMVTTRTGPSGAIQLYNNSGSVHLVADVIGWFDQPGSGEGSLYSPTPLTRVLDTRSGTGGRATPLGARDEIQLDLPVPQGATAAVVNVTATDVTDPGFVTLYPAGSPRPLASNLNPQPGFDRANLTTVALGPGGSIDVYNQTASTDLVIDLVGYYGPKRAGTGGSEYFPVTPERHLDTRNGLGGIVGPVPNTASTPIGLAGTGSIPALTAVTAVDANITVVSPSGPGHTTVWPGGPRPDASVLNYRAGEVVPNRDIVALSGGAALVWSYADTVQYVIDISGWYGPEL